MKGRVLVVDDDTALAEMLGIALLTIDRRLARAPMIRCSVELAGN